MITDLRLDLDKSSVDGYITSFTAELDKLYVTLSRDSSLESQAQADMVKKLRDYVRVTQIYPNNEVPPRGEEDPK